MGTYANFFIEVKDKESGKWRPLKGFYPFKQEKETIVKNDEVVERITKPDLTCADGTALSKMHKLWRQGTIRDLFSNGYFNGSNLNGRGFPDDISEEVKSYFDTKLKEVEEEKKAYFEKYGTEKTWGGKWWWGESFATLAELNSLFEERFEKWKKNVKDSYEKQYKNATLTKKADELFNLGNEILKAVGGKPHKDRKIKEKEEDVENAEYIEYLFEEDIWDIFNLYSFNRTVEDLCELLNNYNDYDNIRVIVWMD